MPMMRVSKHDRVESIAAAYRDTALLCPQRLPSLLRHSLIMGCSSAPFEFLVDPYAILSLRAIYRLIRHAFEFDLPEYAFQRSARISGTRDHGAPHPSACQPA